MLMKLIVTGLFSLLCCFNAWAQEVKPASKPRMQYMGAYDGGQPGVSIYKMFDPTEDVVCYVLMPEVVGRKATENGAWICDANTVGAISCLKARLAVVPVAGGQPLAIKKK